MTTFSIDGEKKRIRQSLQKKIEQFPLNELKRESHRIVRKIISLDEFIECDALFSYYPMGGEVDIIPLMQTALSRGKALLLPRVRGKEMDFYSLSNLSPENLEKNKWGIWEPIRSETPLTYRDFIRPLMIVPGMAFTLKGERLGRGGGFYDRYLSNQRFTLLGASLPFQIVQDLPMEDHDVHLDGVIS